MPEGKELTPAEAYEKLTRRVAYLSKYTWLMRVALVFCAVGLIVSVFTGDVRAGLGLSFTFVVLLVAVTQQNQYKLLLKLLPKPGEATVASGK